MKVNTDEKMYAICGMNIFKRSLNSSVVTGRTEGLMRKIINRQGQARQEKS